MKMSLLHVAPGNVKNCHIRKVTSNLYDLDYEKQKCLNCCILIC
jgi:hypothetical protein